MSSEEMSMDTVMEDEDSFVSNTNAIIYAASDTSGWTHSLISDNNIPNSSSSTSADDYHQQQHGGHVDSMIVSSGASNSSWIMNNKQIYNQRCLGVFEVVSTQLSLRLPKFIMPALHDRLKKGLYTILQIHSLPFAQIWIPCSQSEKVLYRAGIYIYECSSSMYHEFKHVSEDCFIESGKALVGRAFASQGSCFCKDVTLLSINEYPLLPIVREARLTQSFAICLQSKCSKDFVCVVEYFLPPNEMVDAKTYLNMLLCTMKEELRGFIVASGKELGQRMLVEVVKVSPSDELDSFEIGQPLTSVRSLQDMGETTEIGQPLPSIQSLLDGGETTENGQPLLSVQSLQDGGETTKIGQPLPGVQSLLNGGETTEIDSFCQQSNELNGENNVAAALLVPSCSSHKHDSLNRERAVEVDPLLSHPIGEAVTNRGTVNLDVAHDDHIEDTSEMMQLDSHYEQPNLEINSAGNETTDNEKIHTQKNNTIQRIEKDHEITRKILEQQYGMTRKDAADNLHAAPVVPSSVVDKLRIKSIIAKASSPPISLVQFWAPIHVNGSIYLSTADQLFVFTKEFDKRLCSYRRVCLDTLIPIEGLLGPPARVFTRCLPEYNPDIQTYSTAEFPLLQTAICLGIHSYYAFPVSTLHDGRCVGVFEIVSEQPSLRPPNFIKGLNFKSAGLYSIFNTRDVFFERSKWFICDRLDEIKNSLYEILAIHSLPFAQIWIPYSQSDFFQVLYRAGNPIYGRWSSMYHEFEHVSEDCFIESGKALVGRAFASKGSCFCKDVTLLSINEYPLVPSARKARLTQSFAICLQNKCRQGLVCVVEYFLPPNEMVDAKTFLNMLLSTMEEQLPGFIVASGKELGQRMLVEFVKVSPSDELDSFEIGQPLPSVQSLQDMGETTEIGQPLPSVQSLHDGGETTKIGQPLPSVPSLQDGGETTEIDSFCQQSNELNGENNVAAALLVPSCSLHKRDSLNCERTEADPLLSHPIGEAVTNWGKVNLDIVHGVVEDISEAMQLDSQFEQPNLEINSAGNETTNNEKIHSHNKNNVIQRIEKDHGITRKILEQHYSMTRKDAADNLHVSRATLKRICGSYNISRWPHHKTRKLNSHVSQGLSFQGAESYVDDQQCPALSQEKGTDCLGHKRSTATGVPHDSLMTLKVTYRGDIIKFHLPLSSIRAELEGEVEKRLKISLEKFSIKYQDEDDDWILITTDSDLRDGMHSLRLLGRTTMRLLVTPEADT